MLPMTLVPTGVLIGPKTGACDTKVRDAEEKPVSPKLCLENVDFGVIDSGCL